MVIFSIKAMKMVFFQEFTCMYHLIVICVRLGSVVRPTFFPHLEFNVTLCAI